MAENLPQFEKALLTSLPAGSDHIVALPNTPTEKTLATVTEAFKKHFFCHVKEPRPHKLCKHNNAYCRSLFERIILMDGLYQLIYDRGNWNLKDRAGNCVFQRRTDGFVWANGGMNMQTLKHIVESLCSGKLVSELKSKIVEQEAIEAAEIVAFGKRLDEESKLLDELAGLDATSLVE